MRTRLDQLTLHDIVELSCGEISVLLEDGDNPDEKEVLVIARKILDDYKCIASPKQAKIDMIEEVADEGEMPSYLHGSNHAEPPRYGEGGAD